VGTLCNTNVFGNTSAAHGVTGKGCKAFTKNCAATDPTLGKDGRPSGSLLEQRNPTCNSGQYVGGLTCCQHKRIMLDADQTKNDAGPVLRYHMKFRFWFQEYKPPTTVAPVRKASHVNL